MLAAWAFLKSPLGRWGLTALAVLSVLLLVNRCGFTSGVRSELAKEAKITAAAEAEVQKQAKAQAASAERFKAQLAAAQAAQGVRTQTLIQKVPVYVSRKADARCVVNTGFVRLWDSGASGPGAAPDASGGPLEADSGFALSDLAQADLANYGVAYGWKAEAMTWRAWAADLLAHWSDKPARR